MPEQMPSPSIRTNTSATRPSSRVGATCAGGAVGVGSGRLGRTLNGSTSETVSESRPWAVAELVREGRGMSSTLSERPKGLPKGCQSGGVAHQRTAKERSRVPEISPTVLEMTGDVRGDEASCSVRLFGGPEFTGPSGSTTLSGSKQRAIAGRLAVAAGRVVTVDQLIDDVWGEEPPATVRASLQVHISQIRRALADIGRVDAIETGNGGYLLGVRPEEVDLLAFETWAAEAAAAHAAGDDRQAMALSMSAFGLWRGPLLAGAGDAPYVEALRTRCENERLRLVPVATAGSIGAGRIPELLAVIEPLIAARPYDEPLWACLARLLYAIGRQVDALDRLATLRRVLRDELGLVPSLAVEELEHQILCHDPTLLPSTGHVPSLATGGSSSNLPQARPLVGRAALVDAAADAVRRHRVVTLLGPGGIGKTAIAVTVAGVVGPDNAGGACFVDLTSIPPGHDALTALVAALGMTPSSDDRALEEIVELLRDRRQLLVLDNCEHVVSSSMDLAASLAECTGVTILATSREPLAVEDEVIIDVPPLSTADGAELFIRRSQSSVTGFVPDEHDVRAIHRIVELVDGVPLALELASPLIRSLSPADIADEMSRGTALSTGRPRTGVRHASMERAVGWSYDLLDHDARRVFELMSVFAGGTDLQGIVEVCTAVPEIALGRAAIIEVLGQLVNRSLVAAERTTTAMTYRMLAPIRTFAKAKLDASGLDSAVSLAHAHHVIGLLRRTAAVIDGPDPTSGLAIVASAAANIRSAHLWCSQHGNDALAAELVSSFSTFSYDQLTSIPELMGWVQAALVHSDVPSSIRLRLLLAAALNFDGDPEIMNAYAHEAILAAEASGHRPSWVVATVAHAHVLGETDNDRATQELRPAMDVAIDLGDPVLEGLVINYLANHLLRAEERVEVTDLLDRRMALGTRRFGLFEPEVFYQRGRTARQVGDLVLAEEFYRAADDAARRLGSMRGRSFAVFGLADVEFDRGAFEASLDLFIEGLELDRLVEPRELWADHLMVGIVAARLGRRDLVEAQQRALDGSDRPLVRGVQALLAGWMAHLNGFSSASAAQFELAVRRFAATKIRTHLCLALTEWVQCMQESTTSIRMLEIAAELRSGRLEPDEAISILDAILADR